MAILRVQGISYIYVCITVLKCTQGSGTTTLAPSGTLSICSRQLLTLRCETAVASFQQWNITIPQFGFSELRLATAYGESDIAPLRNDHTTFNFVRESDESALPLVVSMTIINAIADLRVSCVEYTGSAVTSVNASLTADIHIITIQHIHGQSHLPAPELDELFGERNITVSLQYTEDVYNGSGYSMALSNISIEVTPPVTVVSNGTCFELILFYNIRYNISASITLCEFTGPSTTSELFYGTCRRLNPTGKYILGENYMDYSYPAPEGTTISFSCPPRMVLIGPNASTCVENGEWKPDPRGVECKANCDVPTHPLNGYILPYSNTIEGTTLTLLCLNENGLQKENITTAVCNHAGNWVPNPLLVCKNITDVSPKAASSDNCINVIIMVISTITVFLLSSVIFFIAGALCMRLFQSKSIEEDSEGTSDTAPAAIQSQPIPILYEDVHDYDFQENVAYGHVMR